MNNDRLAAQLETRIFYFYVVDQKPNEIRITMYGTHYTLHKSNEGWRNASSNSMNMSQPLIDSVVEVVYGSTQPMPV
ncbi:hypothetical protein GCM10023149_28820 [Mucilaginibacter gynuensis]|uniref:Uncharacterized protein n=1 Tax=Mucilaginibacter gynuensis TaxID=1302236 RepID=A0ABP8GL90_9SPHI